MQYDDAPSPEPHLRGALGVPPELATSVDFMDQVSQVRVVRPRRRHQVNHQHEPVNMLMGGKQVMLFERYVPRVTGDVTLLIALAAQCVPLSRVLGFNDVIHVLDTIGCVCIQNGHH